MAFLDAGKTLFTGSSMSRLFPVPPDLPDELERMATWVEVMTGLRLDKQQGLIQVLDNAAWLERRERLMQLGGPPETGSEQRLDPILFGPEPTARARSFMERKQWEAAEAAFDEAMRARPFNISIVVERGDLYTSRGLWSEAADYYATGQSSSIPTSRRSTSGWPSLGFWRVTCLATEQPVPGCWSGSSRSTIPPPPFAWPTRAASPPRRSPIGRA